MGARRVADRAKHATVAEPWQKKSGAPGDVQHQACRAPGTSSPRRPAAAGPPRSRRLAGGGRGLRPEQLRRPARRPGDRIGHGLLLRGGAVPGRGRVRHRASRSAGAAPWRAAPTGGRAAAGRPLDGRGAARAALGAGGGPSRVRGALRPARTGAPGAGGCVAGRRGRSARNSGVGGPQRRARWASGAHLARRRVPRCLGGERRCGADHRPVGSAAGPHRPCAARSRSAARPLRASAVQRRERPRAGGGRAVIRFVLHRPRSSQNIGAAARALANTGAGTLWTVEPIGFDRAQAAKLAAGADRVLEGMRVVRTLDEALEDCVDVVMTTGRPVPGALDPRATARRLLDSAGEGALVFGDEVTGLTNREPRRAGAVATIPTAQTSSLNLAQAVLVFGYELLLARATVKAPPAPERPLADEKLLALLRKRAGELLSRVGFLNPQQPDRALDELLQLPRRGRATQREIEMLLGVLEQIARNVH